MTLDELFTVDEIAKKVSVNPQTVRNWIDRGELTAIRVGSRRVRVTAAELERFLGTESKARSGCAQKRPIAAPPTPSPAPPWNQAAVAEALDQISDGFARLASALRSADT